MKIYVEKSNSHGKGVFAFKDIKKNSFILKLRGEVMHFNKLLKIKNTSLRWNSIQLSATDYIVQKDHSVYLNHSCDPNAALMINNKKAYLKSIKDIKKGEEITIDYSVNMYDDGYDLVCKCGSSKCRGLITEFNTLPKSIRDHYIKLGIVPRYNLKQKH